MAQSIKLPWIVICCILDSTYWWGLRINKANVLRMLLKVAWQVGRYARHLTRREVVNGSVTAADGSARSLIKP